MTLNKTTWCPPIQMGSELAYWLGSTSSPLLNETLNQHLETIVDHFPTKVAVKVSGQSRTYQDLQDDSNSLACALLDLGVKFGSRVAISLGNCVEYLVMFLACSKIGAIAVTLNPAYTPEQTIAAMIHVSASCILTSQEVTPPYKKPQSNAALLNQLTTVCADPTAWSSGLSLLAVIVLQNGHAESGWGTQTAALDFHNLLKSKSHKQPPLALLNPHDVVNLQFTSGTTSMPKAVGLTHNGLLNNAKHIGQIMSFSASDVICCPFPLYHCSGLVVGFLASIFSGATVIFPSESFNPVAVLESIESNKPTVLHGVPTMFEAIIDELMHWPSFPHQTLENLRTGLLGGSSISSRLRSRIHQSLRLTGLINAYGMTELSPLATATAPLEDLDRKLNTVGRVIPHCRVKIVARSDPARVLRSGERGELLVCGYNVMKGYWGDDLRTTDAVHLERYTDGSGYTRWMRTGDEASIDEEGYVRITGRIKDIIIRGGENIYPVEIESCLLQQPGIDRAAIIGLPDPKLGEVLAAFLVASPTANISTDEWSHAYDLRDEKAISALAETKPFTAAISPFTVREHVGSHLAKHQIPKYIFWVSTLPLTSSGKVAKVQLQEKALDLLPMREYF